MTGRELVVLLATAGVSQSELARRIGASSRLVRYWVSQNRVPDGRVEQVTAAIALKPRIYLTRAERAQIADFLDAIARGLTSGLPVERSQRAAVLRDKVRATVGGYIAS